MVERFSMLRPLLLLAPVLVGCSDAGESCGFEEGTFTVQHTAINGDCPDIPLRVVSPRAFPPECTQSFEYQENCGVNVTRECELDGLYGRYVLTLEPKGSGYEGLYQIDGPLGRDSPSCHGLFWVTYIAQ